jgi:hypothetical protein
MRPKIRKVNTKKRKQERKEAARALQRKTAAFLDHPTECCVCATPFVRDSATVKTWQVVINEERVRLTCPTCWATINKVLEKENE